MNNLQLVATKFHTGQSNCECNGEKKMGHHLLEDSIRDIL
jgi:hypothetical protein